MCSFTPCSIFNYKMNQSLQLTPIFVLGNNITSELIDACLKNAVPKIDYDISALDLPSQFVITVKHIYSWNKIFYLLDKGNFVCAANRASLSLVIKDLDCTVTVEEIRNFLTNLGFAVKKIYNGKKWHHRCSVSLFFLDLYYDTNVKNIFKLNNIVGRKIRIEPRKKIFAQQDPLYWCIFCDNTHFVSTMYQEFTNDDSKIIFENLRDGIVVSNAYRLSFESK